MLCPSRHIDRFNGRSGFYKIKTRIKGIGSLNYGGVAQLGERVLCKHEVGSSNLLASTKIARLFSSKFCSFRLIEDPEQLASLEVCCEGQA